MTWFQRPQQTTVASFRRKNHCYHWGLNLAAQRTLEVVHAIIKVWSTYQKEVVRINCSCISILNVRSSVWRTIGQLPASEAWNMPREPSLTSSWLCFANQFSCHCPNVGRIVLVVQEIWSFVRTDKESIVSNHRNRVSDFRTNVRTKTNPPTQDGWPSKHARRRNGSLCAPQQSCLVEMMVSSTVMILIWV